MDDFLNNLSSLNWWLGVVVVSFVVNLASAYIKSPIDLFLSKCFSWYKTRSEKQKKEQLEKLSFVVGNKDAQAAIAESEIRHKLNSIIYVVLTIVVLLFYLSAKLSNLWASSNGWPVPGNFAQWSFFFASFFTIVFSVAENSSAQSCEALLREARKIERERNL